jgi:hypothetical protein
MKLEREGRRQMRERPYAGPSDTNDFDDLNPDEASRMLRAYKLLGDAFEDATDEEMLGYGRLLENSLELVRDRAARLRQAVRELNAAIELAKHLGVPDRDVGDAEGESPA